MFHVEHLVLFTVLRFCAITGMDVDFIIDFIAFATYSIETGLDRFQNQRRSDSYSANEYYERQ
jgi:hypothetical protein